MCQAYAESHGNIFNFSKTVCMTFKAKSKFLILSIQFKDVSNLRK